MYEKQRTRNASSPRKRESIAPASGNRSQTPGLWVPAFAGTTRDLRPARVTPSVAQVQRWTRTMAFARTAFSGFQYGSGAGPYDAVSRRAALDRLDMLATVFDTAFIVPGTNVRFGVESLLRLVPGIGDVAASALSFYLLYEASRLGVPRLLMARMAANVVLEGAVGAVPFAGDAFDIFFRATRRNVALLRRHFARVGFV